MSHDPIVSSTIIPTIKGLCGCIEGVVSGEQILSGGIVFIALGRDSFIECLVVQIGMAEKIITGHICAVLAGCIGQILIPDQQIQPQALPFLVDQLK